MARHQYNRTVGASLHNSNGGWTGVGETKARRKRVWGLAARSSLFETRERTCAWKGTYNGRCIRITVFGANIPPLYRVVAWMIQARLVCAVCARRCLSARHRQTGVCYRTGLDYRGYFPFRLKLAEKCVKEAYIRPSFKAIQRFCRVCKVPSPATLSSW